MMKKRFLLILTFGVSFAPAVFATEREAQRRLAYLPPEKAFMAHRVSTAHTGEAKISEMGTGSWRCDYAQLVKEFESDREVRQPEAGKAGLAASARGISPAKSRSAP